MRFPFSIVQVQEIRDNLARLLGRVQITDGTDDLEINGDGSLNATVSGTVIANQGAAAAPANRWPVSVSDGTNSMPTMDAVGRHGYMQHTDGTNSTPAGDNRARSIYFKLTDGTHDAKIDPVLWALLSIDVSHHEVHEGDHYFINDWANVNGSGTDFDVLIITPNTTKWGHFTYKINSEAEFTLYVYEDTTVSGNGAGITTYNNNRNSGNSAGLAAYTGPTVTGVGTQLQTVKVGTSKETGTFSHGDEIILKQDAIYLFRFTKTAAGTDYISYQFSWYEHTSIS